MPTVFLLLSLVGLAYTVNALRPVRVEALMVVSFVAGWLTSELPIHLLFWQAVATGSLVALGALHGWQGWLGLAITAISWTGLVQLARTGARAGSVVDEALREGLGVDPPDGIPTRRQWWRLVQPFAYRDPAVRIIKDVPYVEGGSRRQRLDIHLPRRPGTSPAPVLVYIHGGAWVIGNKKDQGLPMINHLVAKGWICVSPNYRLSPAVTFPEHLIDCKRALAWVKENIADYGGDPTRVAVSGGSAGGHLCSLLALTSDRPDLQPGFEEVDVSVRAAVPIYGVYDFTNRDSLRGKRFGRALARTVMGATLEDRPDLYALASPMDQVRDDAPPFMIVHGSADTLVPVAEARHFAAMLGERSHAPVVYAELPGAHHAFDVFRSLRSAEVVPRIEVFLRVVLDPADPDAVTEEGTGACRAAPVRTRWGR